MRWNLFIFVRQILPIPWCHLISTARRLLQRLPQFPPDIISISEALKRNNNLKRLTGIVIEGFIMPHINCKCIDQKLIVVYSLMHSFIHSFTHSCTHLPIHSLTHKLIHLLIHPLMHSFIYSFTHSCTHSFTHSLTHALIHLLIHSLMYSFTYSFTHS